MIKETKLFYPHIVKQYDDVNQMISDNNYTSYYNMMRQVLTDAGIDIANNTVYQEALTEDKFEGIITVIYPNTDAWAFGIFITVVCYAIFIPFEVSEQFKTAYSTILGIIAAVIQYYRLKQHDKKEFQEFIYIKEDLISEFKSKNKS